ncbi:MAG: PKD domain-containing protein, partial [Ekhidna sp.]|nr:PKD domain-containing protein [Ekhidna sp.]
MISRLSLTIALIMSMIICYAQCDLLSGSRRVDYETDGTCAPVEVTRFEITYTFIVAQEPADIMVRFFWNDPANTTEDATITNGKLSAVGNMEFTATASAFTYDREPECFFEPQSFIYIAGTQCESSEQVQLVTAWDTDDDFGGEMDIAPSNYDVCENTAISNVIFTDASVFNCNLNDSPDNPNQITRHTQFVYGTNYLAGSIRDITLNDIGVINVTDGDGNLIGTETRGTPGLLITGGYFGAIDTVFTPANAPTSVSLPLSAPANPSNAIGSQFEITLFNWNTCNPFNGDINNPNYEDAVSETALITIVAAPAPGFIAREGGPGGPTPDSFCINEDIYFDNQTPGAGGLIFRWEFYDGDSDTDPLLNTSDDVNPTFQYQTGGDKLVRLIATDPDADGICEVIYDGIINLSPDAIAAFDITESTFNTVINPTFCQNGEDSFEVGFVDRTLLVPNTEMRYEFYREGNPPTSGTPDETEPDDGSYLDMMNVPAFSKIFTTEEYVVVRLVARNSASQCSSVAEDTVFVYGRPQPTFSINETCQNQRTSFSEIADAIGSLTTQVNDDSVNRYEWDFSYDGSFNSELVRTDNSDFDWFLDGNNVATGVEPATSIAGIYTVGLQLTTVKGGCSDIITQEVIVHPNPNAQIVHDAIDDLCPGDTITFTNLSNNPVIATTYSIKFSHPPSGYDVSREVLGVTKAFVFENPDDSTRTYQAQLTATSSAGCISLSEIETFRVSPDEKVSFSDPFYSFFNSNCSPWVSTMQVAQSTINLDAEAYTWTLRSNGLVQDGYPITVLNSDPDFNSFDYEVINLSNSTQNYQMTLEAEKTGVCISSDTFNIQISPQPAATFTLTRADDCDQVVFTLEATQKGLVDYDWTFSPTPDITAGNDESIQVSYTRRNATEDDFNATIALVTTNLAPCISDPEVLIETIEKKRPPITAAFEMSTTELQLPENTITLTNNSSTGTGFSYLWDFGDGTTSTEQNPGIHEYNRFGTYTITLEVKDNFCTAQTSQSLTVLPASPQLDFEADILEGCAPLTVQFTNLSIGAVPGEYLWEFGDGSISRADNPTYTFFQSGEFSIRLRGENEIGETAEVNKEAYITVHARPFADFLVSSRVVYIPDQEAFFNNLSKNATSYFWDFGDGTTSI